MTRNSCIRIVVACALAMLTSAVAAAPTVPLVYEDDRVLIRAGIAGVGSEPIHLGDAVSLVVAVEFDAGAVRIESLDDEWLQRVLAGVSGIRVHDTVTIAEETAVRGRVRVASHWQLQALDCPDEELSCPGSKTYELPIMSMSYELAGAAERGGDSRSARFRPWPGALTVVPAIGMVPEPGSKLTDILPDGARPALLDAGPPSRAGTWLLAAGAALLAASLIANLRQPQILDIARHRPAADTRWQHALDAALGAGHEGEERADLLRRAVTWYCIDELGRNPFTWLGPGAAKSLPAEPSLAAWQELFLDVLDEHGFDMAAAEAFAARFRQQTGGAAAAETTP